MEGFGSSLGWFERILPVSKEESDEDSGLHECEVCWCVSRLVNVGEMEGGRRIQADTRGMGDFELVVARLLGARA